MTKIDRETQDIIDIVERGLNIALRKTATELNIRLARTEQLQVQHGIAGRGVEAAACAIRAQALREAIAVLDGAALGEMQAIVRAGRYMAKAGQ